MTKDEFRPLMLFLAKGCRTEFDRDQVSAWFAALSDLPAEAVAVGIARFVCEVGNWPNIATIRGFGHEALHGQTKPFSESLEETRQAIRRHGLYGRTEAQATLDERTWKTIKALGRLAEDLRLAMRSDRNSERSISRHLSGHQSARGLTTGPAGRHPAEAGWID